MVEVIWKLLELGLVIFGTSIYWILRRDKDAAAVSAIILGMIDKSKWSVPVKVMVIDRYTASLKKAGFDMTKFSTEFKKKYDEA